MASNRHLGRIIALQTLYEYDFRVDCADSDVKLSDILARNIKRYEKSIDDKAFIKQLADGVVKQSAKLDKIIQPIAPEWPIDQIARVDRTILRMAVYELTEKSKDVPPKVVINEAVELAKAFGSDNSSKFVNGVLGTAYRTLIEGSADAEAKV